VSSLIVAEPASAYGERPRLVVDASVLAAGLFDEDGRDVALSWMRGRTLCAPHLVDCEIANVALAKIQRKAIERASAAEALQVYAALHIERHPVEPPAVFALAMRTRLTAYDAAYLWLAETLHAPLATFDARLGKVAVEHLSERR
jgi:predicted nucleic acid-binding protein